MQIFVEASGADAGSFRTRNHTPRARGRRRAQPIDAEIRVNRTGVTAIRKRLEDMSREMDDLIVTAHPTLDTEQGCGPEAVRSLAGFAIDPAKAAALMQEMQPGASCWRSRSPTPTRFASHRPSTPPPRPRSQQPRRQASPSGE